MAFVSLDEIVRACDDTGKEIWEIIAENDARDRGTTEEDTFEKMKNMYLQMRLSDSIYDGSLRSRSGLAGGDGQKMQAFMSSENRLISDFLTSVMAKAIKMGESNACMRRIVAAPTAGSCGVIPAVLLTYEEYRDTSEDQMVKALLVAAGIGEVIASVASISGAEGGCQAEIGSASAMAAGALTFLEGGSPKTVMQAVAIAVKSILGLTCDPVAGLVEVPCIKRNASGAVNAIIASQMAMAGIESRIPPDEVLDSMRRIGKLIPQCLRETGEEGLATTPTAITIKNTISE